MIAKYKMIDLVNQLKTNSDRRIAIRTEQGKFGNYTPEINNQEFISLGNETLVLQSKLDKLKNANPISWLEIQPKPLAPTNYWDGAKI
tara:strand:- start:80 stop:343 length:264 start_codon:yes stop_codon:yes gene_type:complete